MSPNRDAYVVGVGMSRFGGSPQSIQRGIMTAGVDALADAGDRLLRSGALYIGTAVAPPVFAVGLSRTRVDRHTDHPRRERPGNGSRGVSGSRMRGGVRTGRHRYGGRLRRPDGRELQRAWPYRYRRRNLAEGVFLDARPGIDATAAA